MSDINGYLIVAACAAIVTFAVTPFVMGLARLKNWMAQPDPRVPPGLEGLEGLEEVEVKI
jgi:hypothetical protein